MHACTAFLLICSRVDAMWAISTFGSGEEGLVLCVFLPHDKMPRYTSSLFSRPRATSPPSFKACPALVQVISCPLSRPQPKPPFCCVSLNARFHPLSSVPFWALFLECNECAPLSLLALLASSCSILEGRLSSGPDHALFQGVVLFLPSGEQNPSLPMILSERMTLTLLLIFSGTWMYL